MLSMFTAKPVSLTINDEIVIAQTSVKHSILTDSAYVLSAEAIAQGMILACQSLPKTDVNIHVNLRQRPLADEPQA
jgi:hypothetical protein